jgi:hypothetical protein
MIRKTISHYRILARTGSRMSGVYEAEDLKLCRHAPLN